MRLFLAVLFLFMTAASTKADERVIHSFKQLSWALPNGSQVIDEVAQKAPFAGIQVAKDGRIFVTTPRWLDAIDVSQDGKTLYFTSNRLHRAFGGKLTFDADYRNFEIWRVPLN